jgi:hypothetical protein
MTTGTMTTVDENNMQLDNAVRSARARVEDVLCEAMPHLCRLGTDSVDNRALARRLAGVPADLTENQYFIRLNQLSVGVDTTGVLVPKEIRSPAQLDQAMADARLLVRLISDGVNRYMAGHTAEVGEACRQLEASAR